MWLWSKVGDQSDQSEGPWLRNRKTPRIPRFSLNCPHAYIKHMKNALFLEDNLPTFTPQVPEKIMELHHLAEAMRDLASKPGPDGDINLLEGQEVRVEPVYAIIMGLDSPKQNMVICPPKLGFSVKIDQSMN